MTQPELPITSDQVAAEVAAQPSRSRFAQALGRLTRRRSMVESEGSTDVPELLESPVEVVVDEAADTKMSVWKQSVETELSSLQSQQADNSRRAARSWDLLVKLGQEQASGRRWQDGDEMVRAGIKQRYGSQTDLHDTERRLSQLIKRRSQQLDYAVNFNQFLEFSDEIDPNTYKRYIGEPGQLGPRFNLPATERPTTNPEQAAAQLNELPFVGWKTVNKPHQQKQPSIKIQGNLDFPAERIIGVESFVSWAGRGEMQGTGERAKILANGKAGKSFVPLNVPHMEATSRGAITDYAQTPYESQDDDAGADIKIIRDKAGEYWGIAITDGSHRLAAAKLRGESVIPVGSVEIASEQDMPYVDYAVQEKYLLAETAS